MNTLTEQFEKLKEEANQLGKQKRTGSFELTVLLTMNEGGVRNTSSFVKESKSLK